MRVTFFLLAAILLLPACAEYHAIGSSRVQVAHRYTIQPPPGWNARQGSRDAVWTADGDILERILFTTGLRPGDTLFPDAQGTQPPTVPTGMLPTDAMEFVSESLRAQQLLAVTTSHLQPRPFGSVAGFQFEIDYVTKTGLEEHGIVMGTILSERLYLILYSGARLHYFPKYREDVLRMFESIELQ